jgi:hypothetical protein
MRDRFEIPICYYMKIIFGMDVSTSNIRASRQILTKILVVVARLPRVGCIARRGSSKHYLLLGVTPSH